MGRSSRGKIEQERDVENPQHRCPRIMLRVAPRDCGERVMAHRAPRSCRVWLQARQDEQQRRQRQQQCETRCAVLGRQIEEKQRLSTHNSQSDAQDNRAAVGINQLTAGAARCDGGVSPANSARRRLSRGDFHWRDCVPLLNPVGAAEDLACKPCQLVAGEPVEPALRLPALFFDLLQIDA